MLHLFFWFSRMLIRITVIRLRYAHPLSSFRNTLGQFLIPLLFLPDINKTLWLLIKNTRTEIWFGDTQIPRKFGLSFIFHLQTHKGHYKTKALPSTSAALSTANNLAHLLLSSCELMTNKDFYADLRMILVELNRQWQVGGTCP